MEALSAAVAAEGEVLANLLLHEDPDRAREYLNYQVAEWGRAVEVGRRLDTLYVFLTRKCNLNCQHCYIKGVGPGAQDHDFSLGTIQHAINQALTKGLRRVKVSGGEPLIHPEFPQILAYLAELGLDEIIIETNATLLTAKQVSQLERVRGLTLFVSLDHAWPDKHDRFRGKPGSYTRTLQALTQIGATGIQSVVTTIAYRDNRAFIGDIIELVLGLGISRHRTLLNIHPLGNARAHPDNALTISECIELICSLLASPLCASGRAYLTLPPALTPLSQLTGVHSCGWGRSVAGLMSNGDVSMCSASYDDPGMVAGNIFERPLDEIWKGQGLFEELGVAQRAVKGVCSNCVFHSVCRGMCKMSSWAHYGEKDAPYPLCQEVYNIGLFPAYALLEPSRDCFYRLGTIGAGRSSGDRYNTV